MFNLKIAVIKGDGIGQEVVGEAIRVLETVKKKFHIECDIDEFPYGADYYLETGITIPKEAYTKWPKIYDAVLLGAVGDPRIKDNCHAKDIVLGMRQKMDLYVNRRPVKILNDAVCPLKKSNAESIDFVVFRENTEDLYVGSGGRLKPGTKEEVAVENSIHTYTGVERIIRAAFEYARENKKSSVIMSDKGNAMQFAGGLWLEVFEKIGEEYPEIKKKHIYIDALCAQVIEKPEEMEVIVTSNMFGDILTDICAQLQGGMGMAVSCNSNPEYEHFLGVYEPVHGSAPDIAGKNISNPIAAILCVASLLRDAGYRKESLVIEEAVKKAIQENYTTVDIGGEKSTSQVGDYICSRIEEPEVVLARRILYLTKDVSIIKRQLAGEDIEINDLDELMDQISTDEITPARTCYYYDEKLGDYCLTGLRGDCVTVDSIKNGNFDVIVSGFSKGCGSSRETAPYSELFAGVKLVIARSFEKIYKQNCENIGLLTTTDFSLLEEIKKNKVIKMESLVKDCDALSREIIMAGGLINYSKNNNLRKMKPAGNVRNDKPLTLIEKIIMKHMVNESEIEELIAGKNKTLSVWVDVDYKFSHDYVTPMAQYIYKNAFGENVSIQNTEQTIFFRDHLNFLEDVLTKEEKEGETWKQASKLAVMQKSFACEQNVKLYDGNAICHLGMIENHVLPGQIVVGTDSHSCTSGVLGALCFGVGSTDIVNAWYTNKVRIKVPQTIRVYLNGTCPEKVSAKDIILKLLSTDYFKSGNVIGTCIEFCGSAIADMNVDERATLTNMAVEAGACTGIIAPDKMTIDYLLGVRAISKEELNSMLIYGDEEADYKTVIELDVSTLKPMVALPGDPHNGIPIDELKEKVKIDISYAGSCTGGKKSDMDIYAKVLRDALSKGQKIADGVKCYIQFASLEVKKYAIRMGYIECFEEAGVVLLEPSCGACINAGPGVSTDKNEVTVSSINRNFNGRSGPGKVYLASPRVVIQSAVNGYIAYE